MAVIQQTVTGNGNVPDDNGIRLDHSKTFMLANPNGATVKLQFNPETGDTPTSSKWQDVPDGSFTAATAKNVDFSTAVRIRVNVASFSSNFEVVL